jgi:osmotically-inducible protein OsmY
MRTLTKITAMSALALVLGGSTMAHAETTGQYVDDATLTTKVKSALLADTRLKAMHVSVETDHGTVMLGGTVDSKDLESAAIKIANQVDGVKTVQDNITVRNAQDQ